MSTDGLQVITVVLDSEANELRVDVGAMSPAQAARLLGWAADELEGQEAWPELVLIVDGQELRAES